MRVIVRIIAVLVLVVFFTTNSGLALSPEQKRLFQGGILYYDIEACEGGTSTPVAGGTGDGYTLAAPNLKDPQLLADAINKFIEERRPDSPFVGLGEAIVTGAMRAGINPIAILYHLQIESAFGTANVIQVREAFNAFGRTASPSQPQVQGSRPWYKYDSWLLSVDGGGTQSDHPTYMRERFVEQGGYDINSLDYLDLYAPPHENDTEGYKRDMRALMGKFITEYAPEAYAAPGSPPSANMQVGTGGSSACCPVSGKSTPAQSLNKQGLEQLAKKHVDSAGFPAAISIAPNMNGTSITAAANGDVPMLTRSTYKVYVAYAALRASEAGSLDWNQGTQADFTDMLEKSGNGSAQRLAAAAGGSGAINAMLYEAGLSTQTDMKSFGNEGTGELSTSVSTANDFTLFLTRLQNQQLPGLSKPESYDSIINAMKAQSAQRGGIPAGAQGSEVADKPGWGGSGDTAATNDVGIVYNPAGNFSIAILTNSDNQWEFIANATKEINELVKSSSSDSCANGTNGAVQGNIVQTALNLAWPGEQGQSRGVGESDSKPEYRQAFKQYYQDLGGTMHSNPYSDCGVFVGTVMRASGVDPDYPLRMTGTQQNYMRNSDKYIVIENPTLNDLQPGDIINYDVGSRGHTLIYTGDTGDGFLIADASLNTHVPERGTMANITWMFQQTNVVVARLK